MQKKVLSSIEDACNYLSETAGRESIEDVEFSGDLASIELVINGPRYKGTVPSELARGIWELQEALYKASAFALTGSEDLRRLSSEQRQKLELVFCVKEGSTDLSACLDKFFEVIGDGFKTMNDTDKRRTIVAIAAIVGGVYLAATGLDGYFENQAQDIQNNKEIAQMEIVKQAALGSVAVAKFEKATEDGVRSVLRGVPDAVEVRFGRSKFDEGHIQLVNQRAPKSESVAITSVDKFRVYGADAHSVESTRYVLCGSDGQEFSVTVNHQEYSQDDLDKLWSAVKTRESVTLEVTITKNKNGIRGAQIISVP